MKLTVLAVPGCPNAEVLAGRPGVTVQRQVITELAEAVRWGMHGSPTLLANGHDLFAAPGATPALACRLYPGEDGRLDGAPTVQALRLVLGQAGAQGGHRRAPAR